jgi:hypothetical protein
MTILNTEFLIKINLQVSESIVIIKYEVIEIE